MTQLILRPAARRDSDQVRPSISRSRTSIWMLSVILVIQTFASLTLQNTAFQDEALYLFVGHEYVEQITQGRPVTEQYGLYLSGLPYMYPPIVGLLDAAFGLEGARAFSMFSMLIATTCVFFVSRHLFDDSSALFAALVFALQAGVLLIGRLATYDALSLVAAGLALVCALYANAHRNFVMALVCGLLLLLSITSKYAGLMFVPTILGVLWWRILHSRGFVLASSSVILAAVVLVVGIAAILMNDQQLLQGITQTTTDREILLIQSRIELLLTVIRNVGGIGLLALGGLIFSKRSWATTPILLALIGTFLIPPAYHILKMESVSLYKHLAFGAFFVAPLAGYALSRLVQSTTKRSLRIQNFGQRWWLTLLLCMLILSDGIRQAQLFYREWPNSADVTSVLRSLVRPGSGRYLIEESEVPRYYLKDVAEGWQWNQLYWFYYTDNDGQLLQGVPAYVAAIDDVYFDVILLRYSNFQMADAIDDKLVSGNSGYELVAQIPYSTRFGDGSYYFVWRRRDGAVYTGIPQFADEQVQQAQVSLENN